MVVTLGQLHSVGERSTVILNRFSLSTSIWLREYINILQQARRDFLLRVYKIAIL